MDGPGTRGSGNDPVLPTQSFGVLDHVVEPGAGHEVSVPLRIVQNGTGSVVMLTLFRTAEMTAEKFDLDAQWVERDLQRLKEILEA